MINYESDEGLACLQGHTIRAIWLSADKEYLCVETDERAFWFSCSADCCSESWIENIQNVHEVRDCRVMKTEIIAMPAAGVPTQKQESLQRYGYQAFTPGGVLLIEMRNESNGYYGGYLQFSKDRTQDPHEVEGMNRLTTDL